MEKTDKEFSIFVRKRDADARGLVRCCTCGSFHEWKYLDCGHFMSRRYKSTRFDEKNTGPQCKGCNVGNQGRQYEFAKYLDKKYGPGTADEMEMKSKMFCKRGRYDYEVLIDHFKKLNKDYDTQRVTR